MNCKWKNKLELKCLCCKNSLTKWKWIHELFRGVKFKRLDLHLRYFSVFAESAEFHGMNQGDNNKMKGARAKRNTI